MWVKFWVKIASREKYPLSGIIYKTIIPKIYTHIFSHECLIQNNYLKESLEIERKYGPSMFNKTSYFRSFLHLLTFQTPT